MEAVLTSFKRFSDQLSRVDLDQIRPFLTRHEYQVGHQLLVPGQVCRQLFFLEQGLVRCYTFEEDRTLWYEFEGSFFTHYASFSSQAPAKEGLTLLESSTVYAIRRQHLYQLYEQSHAWANWGRAFMEYWYLVIEDLYHSLLYKNASERYEALLTLYPEITQRVPLHHIASFLGMSPVSLSRIRAGKQQRRS